MEFFEWSSLSKEERLNRIAAVKKENTILKEKKAALEKKNTELKIQLAVYRSELASIQDRSETKK